MRKIPTVLILGAGISKPYGYPLGSELVDDIFEKMTKVSEIKRVFKIAGFENVFIEKFCDELLKSQRKTIDAFLNGRPEYAEIGKLAITVSLIIREDNRSFSTIYNKEAKRGIYSFLNNYINDNYHSIDIGNLSIITFNYDKSLEQSLYLSIKNSHGFEEDKVQEIMSKIPIVHIHGDFGLLSWENKNGREYQKWQGKNIAHLTEDEIHKLIKISKGISFLYNENIDLKKSREIDINLNFAHQVLFLGFGFDENNMKKLGLKSLTNVVKGRVFAGTCIGINQKRRIQIANKWGVEFSNPEMDALSFLEENFSLFA